MTSEPLFRACEKIPSKRVKNVTLFRVKFHSIDSLFKVNFHAFRLKLFSLLEKVNFSLFNIQRGKNKQTKQKQKQKQKQNKTKQNKTKQNKTKQNKTKQNKTKTKQNKKTFLSLPGESVTESKHMKIGQKDFSNTF